VLKVTDGHLTQKQLIVWDITFSQIRSNLNHKHLYS